MRSSRPQLPPRRSALFTFLAAALLALALYAATVAPSIPAGDSGELITAAATLGVAHPPGYPLYVWLGRVWMLLLPWGSVALRLNLLSALCGAAAAGMIALAVLRLTLSPAAGVAAGWMLAVSAPQWKYSIVAEVFAPNAALAAAALLAFVVLSAPPESSETHARAPWIFLGLVSTLLLALHHTLLLLLMPLLAVALVVPRLRPRGDNVRAALIAAVAGLVPLIQLPLAAHASQALVWGDASTLSGFLRQLLRADYGTFHLAPVGSGLAANANHGWLYLRSLAGEMGAPAVALAVLGAVVITMRHRPLAIALAGFVVLQAAFFARAELPADVAVMRGVIERFYLLPNVAVALLAGAGFAALASRLPRARIAAAALALVAIAPPLVMNARALGPRDNRFTEHLGRGLLASLPARAVLFTRGDLEHNALEYLTRVEHLRPDVTIVDQELLTFDWYVRQLRRGDPGLLPALGRVERITLRDGQTFDGIALRRAAGRVDLLLEDRNATADSAQVATIEPVADPSRSFASTRSGFREDWLMPHSDDRYSGLPGTRNLLWLDHLRGRRPCAFFGAKDDSWALEYELVPEGLVAVAYPREATPGFVDQAARALVLADSIALDDYFRDWPPWSFEATERSRLAQFATRAFLLLSQPDAAALSARSEFAHGRARLLDFATRFEALDPTTDPACLRAVAYLRVYDAQFRDLDRARRDFDRYLATGPSGDDARTARALRAGLGP